MAERFALELHDKLAIIQPPDAKPMLVKLHQHKKSLHGVLQSSHYADNTKIPVSPDEILSVFPHALPIFGKAYNVVIEPKLTTEKISHWGRVTYFRDLSKSERQNFHRGLQLTYRRFVRRYRLRHLLPIDLEVRNTKGKQVGMYHPARLEREHFIELNPASFSRNPYDPDDRKGAVKYIMRVAVHELTHPLWRIYLPDAMKARWIRLYHSFAKIRELAGSDLTAIRQAVIGAKMPLVQYRRNLDDDGKLLLDVVIAWIKKVHYLDIKSLDLLRQQGDNLADYWPHSKLQLSELKIPVTRYAGKNPEECCCESFALMAMGEKLPSTIIRLVRRSIRAARAK